MSDAFLVGVARKEVRRCEDCGRPLMGFQRQYCYSCLEGKLLFVLRFLSADCPGVFDRVRSAYEHQVGAFL